MLRAAAVIAAAVCGAVAVGAASPVTLAIVHPASESKHRTLACGALHRRRPVQDTIQLRCVLVVFGVFWGIPLIFLSVFLRQS